MFRKLAIAAVLLAMTAMGGTAMAGASLSKMCGKPATVTAYDPNGNAVATETVYEPDGWADQYGHCPSGDIALGV